MLKPSLLRHSVRNHPADAESRGETDYALAYAGAQADMVVVPE